MELAPSATRWRNALRLTLLCALGNFLVLAFHLPYGEFLIIFFFAVSQPDAWASLRKARLRGIGTLIGGLFAIVMVIAFDDKPWLALVAQACLFALALFLSRTTTVPYAILLALFTYVIATPVATTEPVASLETILWRILLTLAGAVIGTVAQLLLWPEHPERLLLQQLADRLATAETILDRVINGSAADKSTNSTANISVATSMTGQLDLLASAEAGSRWLRQRHPEQIKLITEVEMIVITAQRLERLAGEDLPAMQLDSNRAQLREVLQQLAQIRRALMERRLPPVTAESASLATTSQSAENESRPVQSVIAELERILRQMPAALAFLPATHADSRREQHDFDPVREPIAERSIFTPDCRLSNLEVLRFALKSTLAATICYVLYQALDWPGISTCVVTALICAQSSFGAGLQKSLLRLVGATLGGLLAVAAVVIVLPNVDGAAAFIVVTSILFFAASWLTVGSSRVSYIGLQSGLVIALVLLNQPDQAIDLQAAGDRILGVFLGITIMGIIDLTLWPNFAGTALPRKLTETLRALAVISRHSARLAWDEANIAALAVHGQIAANLALYNEWQFEFGARAPRDQNARQESLAFISGLEEVFRAQLVMLRQRRMLDSALLPSAWLQHLRALDEALAQRLETLADSPGKPTTDPGRLLLEMVGQLTAAPASSERHAAMQHQFSAYLQAGREMVDTLERLARHSGVWQPDRNPMINDLQRFASHGAT